MPEQTEYTCPDLIASMTADSLEATTLDPDKVMLVRIAALVAMDAPPISYLFNLGGPARSTSTRTTSVASTAIAPIVGTARVASATGKIVRVLDIAIDVAELETDEA